MRSILSFLLLLSLLLTSACNNSQNKNEHEGHDAPAASAEHVDSKDKEVKALSVQYTDVDAGASVAIKAIIDQYLRLKNSLSSDDPAAASAAAKSLVEETAKLDKSLLAAEQKRTYDAIESGLKEYAGQIAGSPDIKNQREYFDDLSSKVYELAKNFGAGRPVYHAHCPMANNNQGALWLSETKEIKNPYFGASMLTCGTVEEEIR